MNTLGAVRRFEATITNQLLLAGADPGVAAAAELLQTALQSALLASALELAEQAAAEVEAQLPGHRITVTLKEGEPHLRVEAGEESAAAPEDFEARLTLRLPATLKARIEEAAEASGQSVNSWVVRALTAGTVQTRRSSGRVTRTIEL